MLETELVAAGAKIVRQLPAGVLFMADAAAERTLLAETARIGVREADLYPSLGLSGSLSGNTSNWGDLTNVSYGSLAAGLTAPFPRTEKARGRSRFTKVPFGNGNAEK